MKTIIGVMGPADSGKSQSIILATRKAFCKEHATLVAKYYLGKQVDIVEVYQFKTPIGNKYVAYASKGDDMEEVKTNFEILDMLKSVANKKMFSEFSENKNGAKNYGNMVDVLLSIGRDFNYDVIVAACRTGGGSKVEIEDYAKENGYECLFLKINKVKNKAENFLDAIARKMDVDSENINETVKQIFRYELNKRLHEIEEKSLTFKTI